MHERRHSIVVLLKHAVSLPVQVTANPVLRNMVGRWKLSLCEAMRSAPLKESPTLVVLEALPFETDNAEPRPKLIFLAQSKVIRAWLRTKVGTLFNDELKSGAASAFVWTAWGSRGRVLWFSCRTSMTAAFSYICVTVEGYQGPRILRAT